MHEINLPLVLAEVTAAFENYEKALVEGDTVALDRAFWNAPLALRYGIADRQYGHAEITAFRAANAAPMPARRLRRTVITTYGRDFATANTEFANAGDDSIGRQSQTWLRLPEGWRIVAAHVSVVAATG